MPYLVKTEPSVYSIDDLARDGETIWDGVTSPAGVKFLREMKSGEMFVIYHTGDERTAVGLAKVLSVDPSNPKDELRWVLNFSSYVTSGIFGPDVADVTALSHEIAEIYNDPFVQQLIENFGAAIDPSSIKPAD